jgi:hypothetical protein
MHSISSFSLSLQKRIEALPAARHGVCARMLVQNQSNFIDAELGRTFAELKFIRQGALYRWFCGSDNPYNLTYVPYFTKLTPTA